MKLARSEGDGVRDVDDACHCFFSIRMLIVVFSGSEVPFSVFSVCLLLKRGQSYLDFKSSKRLVYNNRASSGVTYYNCSI